MARWKLPTLPRAMARKKVAPPPPPPNYPPVVLIHGMSVPAAMLSVLRWRLRGFHRRGYFVHFNTRLHDLPECARLIADQVRRLGLREYDAVTHSAGGPLLRWAVNHAGMPAPRRAVMIAPPNGGAWLADHLHRRAPVLYPLLYGEFGLQVRLGHLGLCTQAGTLPDTEVGIIAGGSGTPRGKRNIFGIPTDSDGTVAVDETILSGLKDFALVNLDHTRLLFSSQVAMLTHLFLEHGVFRPKAALGHGEAPRE